jgi:hypothetical protein
MQNELHTKFQNQIGLNGYSWWIQRIWQTNITFLIQQCDDGIYMLLLWSGNPTKLYTQIISIFCC